MAWVRLDDQFPDHPKVVAAGADAAWLFVCGLAYAARYLTDGFLPAAQVPRLVAGKPAARLAARLVEAGLWERVEGGFQIHDYLDYQPARDKALAERDAAKERMRRARSSPERAANEAECSPELRTNFARSSASPSPSTSRPTPVPGNVTTTPGARPAEPTPLPVRSRPSPLPSSSGYSRELNGAMPTLEAKLLAISPQFTAAWIGEAFVRIEADVGPLPLERLGPSLDGALDQLGRAMRQGGVTHPRKYAETVIREYLREQAHEHHAAHPAADPAPAGAGARPPPDRAADAAPGGRGPQ